MAKRILVVDDDELVLIAVGELMKSKGFEVSTVSSGPEALETLEREPFDLCVLDIIMPVMDGYEVCRRIRRMERAGKMPVLMLTAKAADEDRQRGLEAGANLYLPKPISPAKLIQMVEEVLASR